MSKLGWCQNCDAEDVPVEKWTEGPGPHQNKEFSVCTCCHKGGYSPYGGIADNAQVARMVRLMRLWFGEPKAGGGE